MLKALCCIVIICHHYALRTSGGIVDKVLDFGGGTFSLVIFLLLSSYGIVRSEMARPTTSVEYLKKRVWKLSLPYLVVTIVFIAIYWLVGASATAEQLTAARVNPAFVRLGQHQAHIGDMLGYVIGAKSFCGAMWFVGVTLYSYIAYLIAKNRGRADMGGRRKNSILLIYTSLIIVFALFTYWNNFPAHYYRNLWALVLGMVLALYEARILAMPNMQKALVWILVNGLLAVWLWLTRSGDWIYMMFANMGLAAIYACNKLFTRFTLRKGGPVVWLVGLSYLVYLVHGKVLTLEWWYVGYESGLLAIFASIAVAYLFSLLLKIKI